MWLYIDRIININVCLALYVIVSNIFHDLSGGIISFENSRGINKTLLI